MFHSWPELREVVAHSLGPRTSRRTERRGHGGASVRCPLYPHVWTAPSWQGLFSRLQHWSVRPCVRPFSAAHRPLAIMPSADQVPINSPHSTNAWGKWVVLIAGSTGSALRAVCPFQPSRHAGSRRDLVYAASAIG